MTPRLLPPRALLRLEVDKRRAVEAVEAAHIEARALDALAVLRHRERTTVAINRSRPGAADAVELCLLAEGLRDVITVPADEQLSAMLESSTYSLGALKPSTRTAIKRLGLAVADQLV